MLRLPPFDSIKNAPRDHLEVGFISAWMNFEMLAARMNDFAAAVARVAPGATVSALDELGEFVRRDVGALLAQNPSLKGPLGAVEKRTLEAITAAKEAAQVASEAKGH